jgi:hypothetical protein
VNEGGREESELERLLGPKPHRVDRRYGGWELAGAFVMGWFVSWLFRRWF